MYRVSIITRTGIFLELIFELPREEAFFTTCFAIRAANPCRVARLFRKHERKATPGVEEETHRDQQFRGFYPRYAVSVEYFQLELRPFSFHLRVPEQSRNDGVRLVK